LPALFFEVTMKLLKRRWSPAIFVMVLIGFVASTGAQEKKPEQPKAQAPDPDSIYVLGPESQRQSGVPEGTLSEVKVFRSKIYPNTERDYKVYVPAGLEKSKPVKLMVFQDGGAYAESSNRGRARVPIVFDNLLYKKELPAIVGVFINPGIPLDAEGNRTTDAAKRNGERSLEYDTPSAKYAEFLEKEMLPRVEKEFDLKFSTNPNDRAICGSSSGGICAFTAAWERPDLFRKVLSHIGSFTNIRGGYIYPFQIRKSRANPKPLRVFLQDGSNDLDNEFGNWPLANQAMAAALKYARYDYHFEYGQGRHSLIHGGAILPESLKWLWREEAKK
jgi:enterochelin esterase-like enzyme